MKYEILQIAALNAKCLPCVIRIVPEPCALGRFFRSIGPWLFFLILFLEARVIPYIATDKKKNHCFMIKDNSRRDRDSLLFSKGWCNTVTTSAIMASSYQLPNVVTDYYL